MMSGIAPDLFRNAAVRMAGELRTVANYVVFAFSQRWPLNKIMERALRHGLAGLVLMILGVPAALAQDFVWARQVGGPGNDVGTHVAADTLGGVYTAGSFQDLVNFGPGTSLISSGSDDGFITKFDSLGNFVWARQFGGEFSDHGDGVAVDTHGNVLAVVSESLTPSGTFSILIVKLDGNTGNTIWSQGVSSLNSLRATGLSLDTSGNVYTVGSFQGVADFRTSILTSAGSDDAFVLKLDSAGNFVWARSMGGASSDVINGVAVDARGSVYTIGTFNGTADFDPGPGTFSLIAVGSDDAFISKLDGAGDFVWARQLGGPGDDRGIGLTLDANGNVYSAGFFQQTVDFDPGPGTYNLTAAGIYDAFISELDSGGNFVRAQQFGSAAGTTDASVFGRAVVVSPGGNLYVAGGFQGVVDFDPGTLQYNLGSIPGPEDAFVVELDSGWNFVRARQLGGPGDDRVTGLALDTNGDVDAVGFFQQTADFDPGTFMYYLTSAGNNDAFITKLQGCGPFVDASAYGQLLFPPLCTQGPDVFLQNIYDSISLTMLRGQHDAFFLSSVGGVPSPLALGPSFAPLVVDDAVHINGVDAGLGPYTDQPEVPPILPGIPIESNLVPLPPPDVTSLIPQGLNRNVFELFDTDGFFGHTAVYLVRDCGIWLSGNLQTAINWVSHDDQVTGTSPQFEVRYGLISNLQADRNYSRVMCLGLFYSTPAMDLRPLPPLGDGYYYLARGFSSCKTYGDSSLTPDPRAFLDTLPSCP
jgi:hypothetical protein